MEHNGTFIVTSLTLSLAFCGTPTVTQSASDSLLRFSAFHQDFLRYCTIHQLLPEFTLFCLFALQKELGESGPLLSAVDFCS